MRVNPIEPSSKGYKIDASKNKHVEFLYNKALDIIKTEQQSSVFRPYEITFDRLTDNMKKMFDSFKIIIEKKGE